jgi:hypothetical protein
MARSGEIWVLGKLAELANRCGISPTVADIGLDIKFTDDHAYHYVLSGIHSAPGAYELEDEVREARVAKVWNLLGLDPATGMRTAENLYEVEKIVDEALSMAPRARAR